MADGAPTGTRVRRFDDFAEITILEKGSYVSFANCGLQYHIGGEFVPKPSPRPTRWPDAGTNASLRR